MLRWANGRTYGSFSDLDSPVSRTYKGEHIYLCPYCIDVVGKEDATGHLNYNDAKGVGWCYRCETVIFDTDAPDPQTVYERMELRRKEEEEKLRNRTFTYSDWTFPIVKGSRAFEYLESRKLGQRHINFYNLREVVNPFSGVFIPNRILLPGRTDYFTIRRIGPGQPKYRVPKAGKVLWGDWTLTHHDSVIVCEGMLSAISWLGQGVGTVAMLGKSMSNAGLAVLAQHPQRRIILCPDPETPQETLNNIARFNDTGIIPYLITHMEGDSNDNIDSLHVPDTLTPMNRNVLVMVTAAIKKIKHPNKKMTWLDFLTALRELKIRTT